MAGKLIDLEGLTHYTEKADERYQTAGIKLLKRKETVAVGDVRFTAKLGAGIVLKCKTAGDTAETEPEYTTGVGSDVTDGTAVFTIVDLLASGGEMEIEVADTADIDAIFN